MKKINVLIDNKFEVASYMLAFNTNNVKVDELNLWCNIVRDYYMGNKDFQERINLYIPCTRESYYDLICENEENLHLFDFKFKNNRLDSINLKSGRTFDDLLDLYTSSFIHELQYKSELVQKYNELSNFSTLEK